MLTPEEGPAGPLNGVRVGADLWFGLEEWLGWSAQPPVMLCAGDHAQDPPFAPGTSEGTLGSWPFCIFFIICPNWPCTHLFLIRSSIFVFCCSRRRLSRCKHCGRESRVPGPSLSATEDGPVGSAVPGLGQRSSDHMLGGQSKVRLL